MTKRIKRGRDGGFTLLEVLVALALVAVAAVGILALYNDHLRLVGNTRRIDYIALLAREVYYKRGSGLRHPVRMEGVCESPDDGCRWLIHSESVNEPGLALMRITVECGLGEAITIETAVAVGAR